MFEVTIEQNGAALPVKDGVVELKPAPFVMAFWFRQPPLEIGVHANDEPRWHRVAAAGAHIAALDPLGPATAMAEGPSNPDKDVLLNPEGHNFWFQIATNDHRFDFPCVATQGGHRCQRTIAYLRRPGDEQPLANWPENLFLILMSADTDRDTYEQTERARQVLTLRFRYPARELRLAWRLLMDRPFVSRLWCSP